MRIRQFLAAVLLLPLPFFCLQEVQAAKVLNVLITNPESSFDPALASDIGTMSINENLFEPMLRYDYLARPVRLQPNTLSAMPEVSADGLTYTFRLQKGIRFTMDAAFAGKERELTAEDYAYSLRRLYDPVLKSPWLFLLEGKLQGDERLLAAVRQQPDAAYQMAIPGIEVVDRYTLKLRLKQPDPGFLLTLATPATAAVAREVVEMYGSQAGSHPVGTGPFKLGSWKRSFRIELVASPSYRRPVFVTETAKDEDARRVQQSLKGKTYPLVDIVNVLVLEEQQARVLAFLNRELDILEQVPPPLSEMVLQNGQLKPQLAQQGIRLFWFTPLQTYYVWMNMDDPVIGGYTREKIALRRAIALSYDADSDIRLIEKGLAIPAQTPLPPNVLSYDPQWKSPVRHHLAMANALLDRYGYRRGQDGYRSLPDGSPLELVMHSLANATGKLREEVWRRHMETIGVRIRFVSDKHGEILKAARLGKVQMTEANWVGDFPDGENFYQLLYGPNAGKANYSRFNLPEFNQLFEQSRRLPDGPERKKLYSRMAYLMHAYNPWVLRTHPLSADLVQPRVQNYLRHPVEFTNWRYLDIQDQAGRR
ncbi:ABC transporter substrate-binding protein [Undibacterium squillarum]|uniref:Heme-binding protein n=1 Tax=Undibacterium squillarum TaxID=1131567 RepID=A0ABQ2Y4B2_9BURK|nr:ABC transporter substrate-binding protein [Undibacterium squillarum]GGX53415.1 heme-binding protein [Undibacterium squillarum]